MAQVKKVVKDIISLILVGFLVGDMYISGKLPVDLTESICLSLMVSFCFIVFKRVYLKAVNYKEELFKITLSLLATAVIYIVSDYVPMVKPINKWVSFLMNLIVYVSDVSTKGFKNSLVDLINFVLNQFTILFPSVKVANSFLGKYFRKLMVFFIGKKMKNESCDENIYFEYLKKNLFLVLFMFSIGLGSFSLCFDFNGVISRNLTELQSMPNSIVIIYQIFIALLTCAFILFGIAMIYASIYSVVDPFIRTINDYLNYIKLMTKTNLTQPSLSFFWKKRARY